MISFGILYCNVQDATRKKGNRLPKQDFLIKIEQRNRRIPVTNNIIVQRDFEEYSSDILSRMWKYAKLSSLKEYI